MKYIRFLQALDRAVKVTTIKPIATRPSTAETNVRAALKQSVQGHARVIEAAGVYRA